MNQTPKTYHAATGYDRHAMDPHALDWASQPDPYKAYDGLAGVALPEVGPFPDRALWDVYGESGDKEAPNGPDLDSVSQICLLAAGLTARSRQGGGWFYYRSAPSAGALYPNELYFAAFHVTGLAPGIYHVGAHNRRLTRIRDGCFADQMQDAIPGLFKDCAGVFVISGIFFRSAWKYRKRAYRYLLLDGGHLAENLRLAIAGAGYSCRLHGAFDDSALDGLLGLDPKREGSLCCVSLSGGQTLERSSGLREESLENLPHSVMAACRVSPSEIVYPEIIKIHEAAKAVQGSGLPQSALPGTPMTESLGIGRPSEFRPIQPPSPDAARLNYPESVFNRRSKRNFIPEPMETGQLHYLLSLLCRAVGPGGNEHPEMAASVAAGFIAGNIREMAPGFYVADLHGEEYGKAASGNMAGKMAGICLDQAWLKNAGVQFVFMSNLEILAEKWGARGYRYAMLTAGRMAHAVYLGATALNLGCCGIGAFYDGEARNLLGLNDASAMVYLAGVGRVKG